MRHYIRIPQTSVRALVAYDFVMRERLTSPIVRRWMAGEPEDVIRDTEDRWFSFLRLLAEIAKEQRDRKAADSIESGSHDRVSP